MRSLLKGSVPGGHQPSPQNKQQDIKMMTCGCDLVPTNLRVYLIKCYWTSFWDVHRCSQCIQYSSSSCVVSSLKVAFSESTVEFYVKPSLCIAALLQHCGSQNQGYIGWLPFSSGVPNLYFSAVFLPPLDLKDSY